MVFEDNDPSNTTKSRSTGAIALNPTGNAKGDFHFMSLTTGQQLAHQQWTILPMPDMVIAAVKAMAVAEGQPIIKGRCPHFEWYPNILMQETGDIRQEEQLQQPPSNKALDILARLAEIVKPAVVVNPVADAIDAVDVPIINFGEKHPNHNEE